MNPNNFSDHFEDVNPYEDGTNVMLGTPFRAEFIPRKLPWYLPAESTAPENWKDNWKRLRNRFARLIDEREPVECIFVQSRIPARGHQTEFPPPRMRPNSAILAGTALRQEPAMILRPDGRELEGAFTISGANGEPLISKDGRSIAMRFGLWRYFCIQPRGNTEPDFGALPVPGLRDLAGEATSLLYELPADIATDLWKNWRSGFSKSENSGPSLWIDALFELAWRRDPGTALHSRPFAWSENCHFELVGTSLFPRLPKDLISTSEKLVQGLGGYPRAFVSTLDDVSRASVAAIDAILQYGKKRVPSTSGMRFRIGLSFPGQKREYIRMVAAGLGQKLGVENVLYDKFHESEFARPDLDLYLPRLYKTQCELIVVFLCSEYPKRHWCGLEWRSIRQLLSTPDASRIMFIAFENVGELPELGILGGDGYLLIEDRTPEAICDLILRRFEQATL